jgi:hypothetical protein
VDLSDDLSDDLANDLAEASWGGIHHVASHSSCHHYPIGHWLTEPGEGPIKGEPQYLLSWEPEVQIDESKNQQASHRDSVEYRGVHKNMHPLGLDLKGPRRGSGGVRVLSAPPPLQNMI